MHPPSGEFLHRLEQKNELVMELSPILMNSVVPCVFVYGPPGTGKTGLISDLLKELKQEAKKHEVQMRSCYVNCSENRTETVILIEILSQLNPHIKYPRMGWTRSKAVDEFNKTLKAGKFNLIVILDEIDVALKHSGDDILYRLTRVSKKLGSNVSSIVISNDPKIYDYIKPKTQSAFGRIKVIFNSYNAQELEDILKARIKFAFKAKVVSEGVIKKISEIEVERHGDARKSLELLDSCGKLALSLRRTKITLDLVDKADHAVKKDALYKTISSLAKHQKVLLSTILKGKGGYLIGSDVYKQYQKACTRYDVKPLSERRIRTFVEKLADLSLVKTEVSWIKSLKKKSKKITVIIYKPLRRKAVKMIRDSI